MQNSINRYYLYYTHALKDKHTHEELTSKLKEKFGLSSECISIKQLGRHRHFDSIIISGNDILFAIPLESKDEILERYNVKLSLGESLFETHQWILPPFVAKKDVLKLALTPIGQEALELFEKIYSTEVIVRQIKGTYIKIPEFKSYIHLIIEAIESYYLAHIASSITLLLTVIEGISREFCDNNLIKYNKSGSTSAFQSVMKNQKLLWRNKVLFKDKYTLPADYYDDLFLRRVDEGMDLLITYENYGLEYLYKSNSKHPLNRHTILHGTNKSFFIDINFYRLYSCLEALAFAVSLNPFYYGAEESGEALELLMRFEKLRHIKSVL
ncbi:hypothetical protein [Lysinibacillus fusiformis]|uniref:hypothetical protein n=1 Tax=Lysinibacillus fusiformis TaxID=28031 RepID=UPI001881BE5C|nr:hypothetical protein [Lysinibacillus fusiformis]MBD8522309.1 hypothetical protein [Lysinibacillus fusiformis]